MFSKHLPPSAERPRVLALDEASAAELPEEVEVIGPTARLKFSPEAAPFAPGQLDAIVGYAPPEGLENLGRLLRPGGRLILAHNAKPETLLLALTAAGFVHCLVEPFGDFILYRGERPPEGPSLERLHTTTTHSPKLALPRFIFLLITQTPNKPAWAPAAVTPGEKLEWRAATIVDPATGQPALLGFSSLVKAVAFMQAAILAKTISGVNKVGKFRAEAAQMWPLPVRLNPNFDEVRAARLGPPLDIDPQTALTNEE